MHLILDPRSDPSGRERKRRYPNIRIIIGAVSSIIVVFIIGLLIFIIIQYRRKRNQNPTISSNPTPPVPPRLFIID